MLKRLLISIGALSCSSAVLFGDTVLPPPTLATVVVGCVSSTQAFGGNNSCNLVSQASDTALSGTYSDGFGTLTVNLSAAAGYGLLKGSGNRLCKCAEQSDICWRARQLRVRGSDDHQLCTL
jgi:hypothetical protein